MHTVVLNDQDRWDSLKATVVTDGVGFIASENDPLLMASRERVGSRYSGSSSLWARTAS